ncbi:acetyl xylan esterase [Rasamsonia emersonii CBS 393.64]|uniref:Acetyl xylan esterase n=1 Tax=Rasamsonia emersonii (strain ATCC 16479 / CBS 393.64 / IMI 116815) TaxID=1408163 RepID=A0A0F4Z5A3_RASE3|nr:acetyl xylan esterase [Rasamsonia emersonii CBS 393.64]KKA25704.1 acetyl xylan esterase [Rasamsonia emersonii CBS 393.64]
MWSILFFLLSSSGGIFQIMDDAMCSGGDPNVGINNTAAPILSAVGSKVKVIILMDDPCYMPGVLGQICTVYASIIQLYCDVAVHQDMARLHSTCQYPSFCVMRLAVDVQGIDWTALIMYCTVHHPICLGSTLKAEKLPLTGGWLGMDVQIGKLTSRSVAMLSRRGIDAGKHLGLRLARYTFLRKIERMSGQDSMDCTVGAQNAMYPCLYLMYMGGMNVT